MPAYTETEDAWVAREIAGKYRILNRVGQGGMGMVYRAQHLVLGTEVAFKIMRPTLTATAESRERFLREARAATMLVHDNIVQVRDVGEVDGSPYLTMDFCRGVTLQEILRKTGRLSEARAVLIMRQILAALAHAHAGGIVHRDLKPANIMIEETLAGDRVRVLDLGLAKWIDDALPAGRGVTAAGMILGTPLYMSPEQAAGDPVDAASDLYSASVVFYEMLAGRPPITGDSNVKLLASIVSDPPAPLPESAAGDLVRALVMRGLEKSREARPAGAWEYLRELDGTTALPLPTLQVAAPRRSAADSIVGVLALLMALAGGGYLLYRIELDRKQESFDGDLRRLANLSLAEAIAELDRLRGSYPDLHATLDRAEMDLHRRRILERTRELGSSFDEELIERLMGRRPGVIRVIQPQANRLEIDPRRTASLPVQLGVDTGARESVLRSAVLDWTWSDGDWHVVR